MITNIIFSKDRAAQLHLLLESIEKNSAGIFNDIRVIFAASNNEFANAYDMVIAQFGSGRIPGLKFIPEECYSGFKIAVEDSVYQVNTAFTCFMVDDNILYRPIPSRDRLYELLDENVGGHRDTCCFSLRLGYNCIVQDYHRGEMALLPQSIKGFSGGAIKWDASNMHWSGNFGYRLSVDGHIFCTNLARNLVTDYDYHQPNSMEGAWASSLASYSKQKEFKPMMMSYTESVLVNSPTNRVQDYAKNLAGQHFGITAERLNQMYLSGKRIDLDAIDFTCIQGCHQELEMKFK